jgi:hypothetical protein
LIVLFGFLLILSYSGPCQAEAKTASPSSKGDRIQLTVSKGDCLFNICKKYLDSSSRWPEIARINHLANPHMIQPGTRLSVPVSYLKRTPLEGKVTFVMGDAKAQMGGRGDWVPLRLGDAVLQKSNLKTGESSALEITFADGSLFFLKSDTEIGIMKAEQALTSHLFRDLYLGIGRVISRIKEATGVASRFKVHTPSAIASVRGTEFRVAVDGTQATLTEVMERQVIVEAAKKSVELAQGEGTVVNKGEPPIPPRKLLAPPGPADLKTIYNMVPAVTFTRVDGAKAYRVAAAQDKEGKQLLKEKIIKPDEVFSISGLDDGSYFLLTQSIDELGLEGLSSEAYPFMIRVNPLPPITQAPRNGAKTKGKSQEFQWLSVSDAVRYHVQIASDREFHTVIQDKADLTDSTFRTDALEYKSYYFRVSSIAGDEYQGAWSDPLIFSMLPLPPTPAMDQPAISRDEINLRSRSLGEGFTYRFQVAKDLQFKEILVDQKVEWPELTMKKPKEVGTYYVRIAAIDRDGDASEYSPPQSLEIKERFPFEWLGGSLGIVLIFILLH